MYRGTVKITVYEDTYYKLKFKYVETLVFEGHTVDEVMHKIYNNWDVMHTDYKEIEVEKI